MSTAGIVVIGNEVLSGKVDEENARFLIRELRELGVKVVRVAIIRDEVDRIAKEVRELSGEVTHVFTSGGVGSTHDDVTLEGIARAFDVPLERNASIVELLGRHYGERINEAVLRMADLPRGAELVGFGALPFPCLRLRNVYVLPGVPSFLQRKFAFLKSELKSTPITLKQIFVSVGEDVIAERMASVARVHPDVEIGSYPRFDTDEYRVKITIESESAERVALGFQDLLRVLDPAWIVRTL